jgi:ATP-binding protein involved in chromosome partitioning
MDLHEITQILKKVLHPTSGKDIVSGNLISQLRIEENNIFFNLHVFGLNSTEKSTLHFNCVQAIQDVFPSLNVHAHLVNDKIALPQPENNLLPQIKHIIAVGSGKGGVGKSTVSVNMALALKKAGFKTGILDADLYGPSIPTMLGLSGKRPEVETVNNQPKIKPLLAFDMPVISMGFIIEPEQAVVMRGPRLSGIIKQFFLDTIWPDLDFLLVDLPPGTGDVQLSLVQTVQLSGAVIVTTPQEVAVIDAVKALNMFQLPSVNVPIIGVVENMSWFTPAEYPENKYFLFGKGGGQKLADYGQTKVLGQVPLIQGIREGGDNGLPAFINNHSDIIQPLFMEMANSMVYIINKNNHT